MSIKFEGEPPFYLGVAESAAAQVLDTNVIVRVTVSPSKARRKFVGSIYDFPRSCKIARRAASGRSEDGNRMINRGLISNHTALETEFCFATRGLIPELVDHRLGAELLYPCINGLCHALDVSIRRVVENEDLDWDHPLLVRAEIGGNPLRAKRSELAKAEEKA